jgi:hypothetical protein
MMPTNFNWLAGLDTMAWAAALFMYAATMWELYRTIEKGDDE